MSTENKDANNSSGGYVLVGIAIGAAAMNAVLILVLILHCGW